MLVMQGTNSMVGIPAPECVSLLSHIHLPGGQQHVIRQHHLSQSPGRQLSNGDRVIIILSEELSSFSALSRVQWKE